jgi:hypothetical protein
MDHHERYFQWRSFMSISWKRVIPFAIFVCFARANVALANGPFVHFGADWRPLDVLSCTIKAMEAMREQDFIEGNRALDTVWGYNEQSIVLVRCVPQDQGVYIEVLATSQSNEEAERLRNQIRISVFDDRRPDLEDSHEEHFNNNTDIGPLGTNDPEFYPPRQSNLPQMHWGHDTRSKSLASCLSSAKLAMAIYKLESTTDSSIVWGTSSNVTVIVSCVPIPSGVSILVAAISEDGATAERFRNDIRTVTFDSPSN